MKNKLITSLLIASLTLGLAGCSAQTEETSVSYAKSTDAIVQSVSQTYLDGYATFEVTSPDVIDGVWVDDISNTKLGDNSSPELSWEPVEGAEEYVIYMVDRNSKGFLHWKSAGIKETNLPRGWAPKDLEYNGPHVGHGYTHMYDIYVIALKAPAAKIDGAVNCNNGRLAEFMESLNTDCDGNTGNIISYGVVSGTFTDARFRDEEPTGPYNK